MRKTTKTTTGRSRLLVMVTAIFLAGWLQPSYGQSDDFADYQLRVHCNDPQLATVIFSVKGTGMMGMKVLCGGKCDGKTVSFEEALAGLSAGVTAGFRAEFQKHEVKAAAGKAKSIASCGSKCTDNADSYEEYLRKRQTAMELFKHASDLRLAASKLLAEELVYESDQLRWEGEQELAGNLAEQTWREYASRIKRKLTQSRGMVNGTLTKVGGAFISKLPLVLSTINVAGWIKTAALTTHRASVYADQYARHQKEAQEATKKAEQLWREALAAFEESLKGRCSDSREVLPDQDRARLERAKEAIEEWDNNQNLYRDPITNEAVTFSEAIRRANEYLKSSQISNLGSKPNFAMAAFAGPDNRDDKKALQGAIFELDKAIPSWDRLSVSISKYLTSQRSIELKLEEAFGVRATGTSDAKPAKISPKANVKPTN